MNKMLKGLLVTVLAVGAAHANSDHTNKTFLLPRAQGVNLPMEMTTFAELISMPKEDRFGGNFQITGFYQQSSHHSDTADYFLIHHKSTINLPYSIAAETASAVTNDLDLGYLIHIMNSVAATPAATVSLDPEQTAYGARFDYYQNMDKLLKGLYLKVDLPVVHVENDLKAGINSADPTTKTNLTNYLRGDYQLLTAGNANRQTKLDHAKIAGKQSETGVADIDVALGYKFLNKEKYHAGLAIAITIPTGNEADGIYLFEPIVGNGKHFGLGGDFCAGARVWGDIDHNIKLALKLKYRYLFENSEHRTLGIKGREWSQYHLLVSPVAQATDALLTPAANVTTMNLDVTPGSQFDGILDLAYNNGGFNFDLGYNMYFREAESVKLKSSVTAGQYAVAARNMSTAGGAHGTIPVPPAVFTVGVVEVDGAVAAGTPNILTNDRLDISTAETPSQFTNSIYGGLGYMFKEWDTPLMLGIGGKYEWPSKNSALEQWGLWGKLGIAF